MGNDDFESLLESRELKIAVVGLGYVGLPLALAYAASGFAVFGLDVDESRVAMLRDGNSYVEDVSDSLLGDAVGSGNFIPTVDPDVLCDADAVVICVSTPFTPAKDPDLTHVVKAAEDLGSRLHQGMLVILQSTTYPGTTNEVVKPILEAGGLKAGVDFDLAFSPERVDPGNKTWTVRNTPKVVGALTPEGAEKAKLLLEYAMDGPGSVTVLSSPDAAEMTKLLENTFRAVNIALVNEMALLCERMDVDIWEVIRGAATKPFGFMAFKPGPGVGGHCIAVDPHYLAWRARTFDFQAKFIELAADANLRMPRHVFHRIARLLNSESKPVRGSKILVLGAAFKAGVGDTRNSPALSVMQQLADEGAQVTYSDPHVPELVINGELIASVPLTGAELSSADAVVFLVPHEEFDRTSVGAGASLIFDAVNAMEGVEVAGRLERL
ncbi:MAG: UDP-N-acetyl-D-glucosamine dehydrogenase [Acidobacteria bacterium]|nr:MAG: UDP-N-acetyl-D-glucosamine dehydrogenase [Acidobacteriota bacterium]